VTRPRSHRKRLRNRTKRDRAVRALKYRLILAVPCPVPVCSAPPGFFCSSRFRHYLHRDRVLASDWPAIELGELPELRRPLWRGGKRRANPALAVPVAPSSSALRELRREFAERRLALESDDAPPPEPSEIDWGLILGFEDL
jgi:hypothetical protein